MFLLLPFTLAYPRFHTNTLDRFLKEYFKERSESMHNPAFDRESFIRRQFMFPSALPIQQYQPQVQPTCLPHVWTCGPDLPPCCAGLMCYDGNAKRGRHCVARG